MRTDDLIEILSTHVEPVTLAGRRRSLYLVGMTVVGSAILSLAAAAIILGVRSDLPRTDAALFLVFKILFALAVSASAAFCLIRLARPGGERNVSWLAAAMPILAILLLAAASLMLTSPSHWHSAVLGHYWLECVVFIPVIATVPFVSVFWVLSRMAPTDLVRVGAFAGLVSGGIGAAGYALHCTDDSLPFVAVWYGGTIALCALAGAVIGPKLLRW